MSMYCGEKIIERFGLPRDMCSCPFCGRVYGTRLTGERVELATQSCERCFVKNHSVEEISSAAFQECNKFVEETT